LWGRGCNYIFTFNLLEILGNKYPIIQGPIARVERSKKWWPSLRQQRQAKKAKALEEFLVSKEIYSKLQERLDQYSMGLAATKTEQVMRMARKRGLTWNISRLRARGGLGNF
jgi:hypothetical protein